MHGVRSASAVLAASAALVVLGGCAGGGNAGGGTGDDWAPPLPAVVTEVHAVGTVLDDGSGPELCLGPIAESYPPQCGGPPVAGWDWDAVEGDETASGVTWGAYAVWGDWDGETFTITREPIPAALYDPMVDPDAPNPWDESLPAGPLSDSEAADAQAELEAAVPDLLAVSPVNGRVVVEVRFDDGSLQAAADERFGDDAVVVISQLTPVDDA